MKEEQKFKVIIVGGGTGGIAVASRLAKQFPAGSMALFEPSLRQSRASSATMRWC